jgi:hypothetical protein
MGSIYEGDTLGAAGLGSCRWRLANTLGVVIQRRWCHHSCIWSGSICSGAKKLRIVTLGLARRATGNGAWTLDTKPKLSRRTCSPRYGYNRVEGNRREGNRREQRREYNGRVNFIEVGGQPQHTRDSCAALSVLLCGCGGTGVGA